MKKTTQRFATRSLLGLVLPLGQVLWSPSLLAQQPLAGSTAFDHRAPPDPEQHYRNGEAFFAAGSETEARREHEIAEAEIGAAPSERMPKLWLARIYARRGELARADTIYESLWSAAPRVDAEAAINHVEAHILNKDWRGAQRLLERLLERDPKNVRARAVLAWVLEVTGDLDRELPMRAGLASDEPTSANWRDQGRAQERAGDLRAAYQSYETARTKASGQADEALTVSLSRLRYRITPEVAGDVLGRSDPQASSLRVQTGLALPIGAGHNLRVLAWHETSSGQVLRDGRLLPGGGSLSGLAVGLLLSSRHGDSLLIGGDVRYAAASDDSGRQTKSARAGTTSEVVLPFLGHAEAHLRGAINEPWNDAAVTISEGGRLHEGSGQLFLFPTNRRLLANLGVQRRWLRLEPATTTNPVIGDPTSTQQLFYAGIDLVLWSRPERLLRGESLDENLVRRSVLSDAAILSYRHQQLFGTSSEAFNARLVLAPRGASHVGSGTLRLVSPAGWAGIDLRGAVGYDTERSVTLYTGGASVVVAPSWSNRFVLSYDVTKETTTGLQGTRHAGWLSFHADL
jgi:Flp pilus assembly protein TadD